MAKNTSILHIKASAIRVWDTLTKPELVKIWQFGSDLITDWKVGNGIRFITEWEGKVFEQWGNVLEVQPHKLIRYSLFAPRPNLEDIPENYFVMSYVLTDHSNFIKLEIIQEDSRPNSFEGEPQGEENPILNSLKKLAELS